MKYKDKVKFTYKDGEFNNDNFIKVMRLIFKNWLEENDILNQLKEIEYTPLKNKKPL
jgi:hypothetical protein